MKWLASLRRETADDREPIGAARGESGIVAPPEVSSPDAPAANTVPAQDGPPISPVQATSPPGADAPSANVGTGAPNVQPAAIEDAESEDSTASLLARVRDDLIARQQQLGDDQRALHDLFMTRLRSDEAQARAVEKLHDELRQYKSNFVRQQLLPLLKEVIFCHDFLTGQLERMARASTEADGRDNDSPAKTLEAARQMLTDLLFKYDVEPYRSEAETFDPKLQQCTHTVPTARAEADKSIAARGLAGFRSAEAIVRREQVTVYKFTPGAD